MKKFPRSHILHVKAVLEIFTAGFELEERSEKLLTLIAIVESDKVVSKVSHGK